MYYSPVISHLKGVPRIASFPNFSSSTNSGKRPFGKGGTDFLHVPISKAVVSQQGRKHISLTPTSGVMSGWPMFVGRLQIITQTGICNVLHIYNTYYVAGGSR